MILQELFDKPTNIDWEYPDSDSMRGSFKVGGISGRIFAEAMNKEDLENSIESYSGKPVGKFAYYIGDFGVSVEFIMAGGQQNITGLSGKNAFAVFATIKTGINDIVTTLKPDFLYFSANEPSRRKLYDRMIKGTKHFTYVTKDGNRKGYVIAL